MLEPSIISAASQVLGKAISTPGTPAGPSTAVSDNVFDTSGWTVATGNGQAAGFPKINPLWIAAGLLAVALVIYAGRKK